jgi:hypothetical protein
LGLPSEAYRQSRGRIGNEGPFPEMPWWRDADSPVVGNERPRMSGGNPVRRVEIPG